MGMVPRVMFNSFCAVLLVTSIMCTIIYNGHFNSAGVELGLLHYAERLHPAMKNYIPDTLKMPLNSLVNVGYVVVGAAWCAFTSVALLNDRMKTSDATMFYIFNIGSCCYGPIQALRILTQLHGFAVLDQWYTLPFFMWVFIWGLHFTRGWSTPRNTLLTVISISSYTAVLRHSLGFEMCLSVHIMLAMMGAFLAWSANTQARCGKYFVLALLSCSGFVVLKLFDLVLIEFSGVFQYISGHFMSKICDILQIHYANHFFQSITVSAYANSKKKEK